MQKPCLAATNKLLLQQTGHSQPSLYAQDAATHYNRVAQINLLLLLSYTSYQHSGGCH
jgi:hypothetical protein